MHATCNTPQNSVLPCDVHVVNIQWLKFKALEISVVNRQTAENSWSKLHLRQGVYGRYLPWLCCCGMALKLPSWCGIARTPTVLQYQWCISMLGHHSQHNWYYSFGSLLTLDGLAYIYHSESNLCLVQYNDLKYFVYGRSHPRSRLNALPLTVGCSSVQPSPSRWALYNTRWSLQYAPHLELWPGS